eukprot:1180247-Prorocentrum_minimum.AAC.1
MALPWGAFGARRRQLARRKLGLPTTLPLQLRALTRGLQRWTARCQADHTLTYRSLSKAVRLARTLRQPPMGIPKQEAPLPLAESERLDSGGLVGSYLGKLDWPATAAVGARGWLEAATSAPLAGSPGVACHAGAARWQRQYARHVSTELLRSARRKANSSTFRRNLCLSGVRAPLVALLEAEFHAREAAMDATNPTVVPRQAAVDFVVR